jgi:hypothetical protein
MAFGIDDAIAAGLKVCRICKETKPTSEFYFRKDNNKYKTECHACKSKFHKEYYKNIYSETAKKKSREFREKDQRIALLASCKASARNKGLDFNLTIDDINIPDRCPYLDIKLTNIQGMGKIWSNASVDRIDSNKGYITGNVQVISCKANTMKNDVSIDELRTFCLNVLAKIGVD